MKILINVSNLVKGGGIQVAESFLDEIKYNSEHDFIVILSPELKKKVRLDNFSNRFIFIEIEYKKNLLNLLRRSRKLSKIEEFYKVDVVFTVFGPAYWRPKNRHVAGYAIPHFLYLESPFLKSLSIAKKIRQFIMRKVIINEFRRGVDILIVESNDAKQKLINNYGFNGEHIHVVSNTYNPCFNEPVTQKHRFKDDPNFKLLILSSFYPHKNLDVINKVTDILEKKSIKDVRFIVTLNESDYKRLKFHKNNYVINVGPQLIKDCPSLYEAADSLLLPTMLECFSANYVESMKMKRPILTSNYSFAKGICGDAALYFDPQDPRDIVKAIMKLKNDPKLYGQLVERGSERLQCFETNKSRAEKYIKICSEVAK